MINYSPDFTGSVAKISADLLAEASIARENEAGKRARFVDQGAAKSASYAASAWDSATFNATAGSISQALPASPASGDEVEFYLSATSGTNVLTVTGTGGPFSTTTAGHGVTFRWTGSAWVERQDRKTKASLDAAYPRIGGDTWLKQAALAQAFLLTSVPPTYDATFGTLTASNITWPDDTTGAYATTSLDSNGAVTAFTATYVGSTTKTVTVTIPRNSSSQVNAAMTASVA
jgi:hypothetical protein